MQGKPSPSDSMLYPLENLTPLMRQYFETKAERPDVILLMRVGDFYEAYGDDAELLSLQLEITLTGREDKQFGGRIPMAGVPYHAVERFAARLIARGYRIAVCEQVEDPKQAKGLVKRRVTRILTPGTVVEESMLDARSNNYLVAAITGTRMPSGIGVVDVSTGEFLVTELPVNVSMERVIEEIARLQPTECLLYPGADEMADAIKQVTSASITFHSPNDTRRSSRQYLLDHFGTESLVGFGCEEMSSAVDAAALLIDYLKQAHTSTLLHIRALSTYSTSEFMSIDSATRRNLELNISLADGVRSKSLISIIDKTVTAMGGRLLRRWLDAPLLSVDAITQRQNAVRAFAGKSILRGDVRDSLRHIGDLERLISRIGSGLATGRDLAGLRESLKSLPSLVEVLNTVDGIAAIDEIEATVASLPAELLDILQNSIADEPPMTLREGGLIKDGYNQDLDTLRDLRSGGKSTIARIEETEREETGIKGLKIGFNNVFGYYIEISKNNSIPVPETYFRKQTTANAERYITPTLKEYEAQVLGAHEKIVDLEYKLFTQIRDVIAAHYASSVLTTAAAIARLDVFSGLAEAAITHRYTCPEVHEGDEITIVAGRHPVVESLRSGNLFVPNDTYLNCADQREHIITGPNSAGKSTYLRQVALIVLLAQTGSFVPADRASIGLVDRIFTRVGAHDDLAAGQSTFMVEMSETANILNNATARSLVILDEVGRGTSTFDGLALAWAVAESLHGLRAKTLFATHYHHLNELERILEGTKNYRVAVKEQGDHIIWLRKIMPGGTDRSYGIQVARLAGVPEPVLSRAREVLKLLESNGRLDILAGIAAADKQTKKLQLTLFEQELHPVVEQLQNADLSVLSPIEALNLLYSLQIQAGKPGG